MNQEKLKDAIELAKSMGYVLVATANTKGIPHVAVAGIVGQADKGHISVTDWFCDGTVTNLRENKHVTIVVWDKDRDRGYQLMGMVTRLHTVAMMDGFPPEADSRRPPPQAEREIIVRIDRIVDFKHALHSDEE